MKDSTQNLAKIKGMPIEKATSFEPLEIKGIKPDIKLSLDEHNLETTTKTYQG